MLYFSRSGGTGTNSTKSTPGHLTPNLCFQISVCPGHETFTHYFLCLSGTGAVSIKSALKHITPNLCFCIW
jgi:hypothetical protein